MDAEHNYYLKYGAGRYRDEMVRLRTNALDKGIIAFPLIEALLGLNEKAREINPEIKGDIVEVTMNLKYVQSTYSYAYVYRLC